jgi:hypothetical protein
MEVNPGTLRIRFNHKLTWIVLIAFAVFCVFDYSKNKSYIGNAVPSFLSVRVGSQDATWNSRSYPIAKNEFKSKKIRSGQLICIPMDGQPEEQFQFLNGTLVNVTKEKYPKVILKDIQVARQHGIERMVKHSVNDWRIRNIDGRTVPMPKAFSGKIFVGRGIFPGPTLITTYTVKRDIVTGFKYHVEFISD